ncbi:hypothetical protein [Winogradskyella forsetii]|uniref:hypothetical protein n=1 Tax=Winogradskyella forsetii TaxID=2686077 RepID=UPI0015C05AC9|nr:hypothetical protein [Winogradskyella forsetii]
MKYLMLIFSLFSIVSCQQKENNSLEPLKIDYIDNIPFLMTQMEIDSVLEVVNYGRVGSAEEGEIFNSYVLYKDNIVKQRMNSSMCCSYGFRFDSLGVLVEKHLFSDYSTNSLISYEIINNRIKAFEKDNFNETTNSTYIIEDERILSKTGHRTIDSIIVVENIEYAYNNKNQLIEKIINFQNHPEKASDDETIVKTFLWSKSILNETDEKEYYPNGIDYFETITKFDSNGFPSSKIIKKNSDTICKTRIEKF